MFLDILRNRLSSLEVSISQQEHLLQQLKEQRAAVQLQLDLFIYPILTLPREITSEIFLWCSAHNCNEPHPSLAPLLLLKVCRAWRALALSVPALWDSLADAEFRVPEKMEDLITTWFSRAGARPLSLHVTYIGDPESFHMHSLIRRHASRLESLDLCTDGDCFSDLADIRPFPLLRDLTLASLGGMLEPNGNPIPVFSGAPLLRHLSVEHLAPSALMMPWSQLTKFTAILVTLQECLGVLRLATSLCEFHRFSSPEEESIIGQPLVCHSGLNSLIIEANDGVDHDILQFLTLPGLQKLELGSRFGLWTSDMDSVVLRFLFQTSTTLRTVTVGMSPVVPLQWFQILTHLTTLELVGPKWESTTEVVRALDRRNAPDFLPKLQNLAYLECASDQVNVELLDALSSRYADEPNSGCTDDATDTARARLQSFRLIWPEHSSTPVASLPLLHVATLRALASRGMHIHIGTRYQNNFY
ncbi:hypothetical protein B0H10DRAFT_358846 [Mycena sp. CBHHK59/15]|nr:hypothetical protein B0H10DRAFT_358846 [Mycena sp. CBHHK59/15]